MAVPMGELIILSSMDVPSPRQSKTELEPRKTKGKSVRSYTPKVLDVCKTQTLKNHFQNEHQLFGVCHPGSLGFGVSVVWLHSQGRSWLLNIWQARIRHDYFAFTKVILGLQKKHLMAFLVNR